MKVLGDEEILRVAIQAVGIRVSRLIGEKEKNRGEEDVDNDLPNDFSHFDFMQTLLTSASHLIGIDRTQIEQPHATLTSDF